MTLWRWEGGLLWKGHRRRFTADVDVDLDLDLDLEQQRLTSSSAQTGFCGRVQILCRRMLADGRAAKLFF